MQKTTLALLVLVFLVGCSGRKTNYDYPPIPQATRNYPPPIDTPIETYKAPQPEPAPAPAPQIEIRQPEITSPVSGKDFVVKNIAVKMGKIDDIGLLFVRHSDGNLVLAQSAAWKYGVSGSASGSINQYLNSGTNLVIFALYNHKAKSLPFGQSVLSKWSYEFSLFGDGTAIFNDTEEGKQLQNGVVSWKAFSVASNGNGQFIVSKPSDSQLAMLKPAFSNINADFIRHPVSDNVADISAAIAVGIRTGVLGSN